MSLRYTVKYNPENRIWFVIDTNDSETVCMSPHLTNAEDICLYYNMKEMRQYLEYDQRCDLTSDQVFDLCDDQLSDLSSDQ